MSSLLDDITAIDNDNDVIFHWIASRFKSSLIARISVLHIQYHWLIIALHYSCVMALYLIFMRGQNIVGTVM